MRTLGTLILLSAAAFAQAPTAVQNPAAPATVSVQPATNKTQAGKPSPNGAKASAASVTPKTKAAVSVKATSTAKTATSTQKAVSVKPAVSSAKAASVQASAKPAVSSSKATISTGSKSAPAAPAAKAVSVKAAADNPARKAATAGPKAVSVAKGTPVVGVLAKPAVIAVAKGASPKSSISVKGNASTKPAVAHVGTKPASVQASAGKAVAHVKPAAQTKVAVASATTPKEAPSVQDSKAAAENKEESEIHTAGRRDPFLSPVVTLGATGSGCSAGKRCLSIDQIALKGVVKSESGMIAVVTNSLDKAYFLRENDPVFNGYVVKITGDSIIFKETFHDRLGKALTRDVTKSITRPVA
jgi:Tfp pilus assembly protein PilP